MDGRAAEGLLRFFRDIQDPRADDARHEMGDVITVAILAVIRGARGWVEAWGRGNREWLGTFLGLPHDIPSHDTFDRVFALLDPSAFERCFTARTAALVAGAKGLFVAADGKTLRRGWKRAWSKTPVHRVGAFASKNRVALGQVAADAKSDEITAMPRLLAMPDLADATVTSDAMGWRREIAGRIIGQGAHYVLALKDNQPTPHDKVTALLDEARPDGFRGMRHGYVEETDAGHGRVQTRRVWVTGEMHWLGAELLALWPGLAAVAVVESARQDLGDLSGKVTVQRRYFITSHAGADAAMLAAAAVRGHRGVENGLHWRLDVQMDEDQCRVRVGNGAENFSRLRRIAPNKLKRWEIRKESGKVMQAGLRLEQQACGWSRNFPLEALSA